MSGRPHISGPLPFVGDLKGFDKAKLSGAVKFPSSILKGPKRFPVSPAEARPTAAEEASKQRPRDGDELGYEMLLQRIRSRRVVPFVGAGNSMPLLPSWWQVLNRVAENLGLDLTVCDESAPVVTEMLREKIISNKQKAGRKVRAATEKDSGCPSLERYGSHL